MEARERERLVDRPALRSALDGALGRRLTLIVAQAGSGKTTLLRQWAGFHTDVPLAALDIERSDDDPVHFVRRLIGSLPVGNPALARLSESLNTRDARVNGPIVDALASALSSLPEIVIVIDDAHRFSNVRLVADLGTFVEQIPRNIHVILSSRIDPPLALSRYRLDDELLELRSAQLAFTEPEADQLLTRIVGHRLAPSQVRALWERTEGWAAGLQLAGLHLRQEPEPDTFIAAFGGSDRLVADYLSEEVLAGLPGARRRLLLEMSALDDMSASLVEAAIGIPDAQSILEELERESMFLVPLDSHREWFRFHRLFSDLLRSRLRAEDPAGELKILTAAADWHLAGGRVKPAMEYLIRAQAWDGAMEAMLSDVADRAANDGVPVPTAPPPPLPSSAALSEEFLAGARDVVGASADVAESRPLSGPRSPGPGQNRRGLGFVAAQVLWRARPDVSTEVARRRLADLESRARAGLRKTNSDLAHALVSGGRAYFLAGNMAEARAWLKRAIAVAVSDVVERVSALSALSLVEAWSEHTARANALVFESLQAARSAGMLAHPSLADAYLASVLTAVESDGPGPAGHAPGAGVAIGAEQGRLRPALTLDDASLTVARLPLTFGGVLPPSVRTVDELADPLTQREMEILAYLPTRFTNIELARRCFVSVNTIKTHMAHIYRKLDVTDRDTAIVRAQELGLL